MGIAIQVGGMHGVKDTSMGHTQGLTTVPTSRGTRDRRTTHTHLTTAPTSSGTGGRRTTHRRGVVSGAWGWVSGSCQRQDNGGVGGSESVRGRRSTEHTDRDTHTQRQRGNTQNTHTQCVWSVKGHLSRAKPQWTRSKVKGCEPLSKDRCWGQLAQDRGSTVATQGRA